MKPYALIDLHCDTLTDCKYSSGLGTDTLDDPSVSCPCPASPRGSTGAQFYAIFIPDECRGEDAIRYYEANRDNFIRQMDKFSDRVKRCRTCADMEGGLPVQPDRRLPQRGERLRSGRRSGPGPPVGGGRG